MNNTTSDIFSKTECISSEVLKAYLTGNISEEEKRKVEIHLVDCEMCNDELEGLQHFENIEKANKSVNEVKQKVLLRFGRLKQRSNAVSIITGIAASVLIAVISGYLIMHTMKGIEKKEIAQHVELKEEKAKEIVIKDSLLNNKIYDGFLEVIDTEEEPTKQQDNKSEKSITTSKFASFENGGGSMESKTTEVIAITVTEDDIKFKDEGFYDEAEGAISTIETTDVDEKSAEKDEKEMLGRAVSYDAIGESVKEEPSAKFMLQRSKKGNQKAFAYQMDMVQPLAKSSEKYDLEFLAKQAFEQKDYKNAYEMFLNLINNGNTSDSLFYYYAVSCYNLNLFDSTIIYINKIKDTNIFKLERKWYLANAYLKTDSITKAIPLLNELSQTQNEYTGKAVQLLSEIESDD